jgi:hypothetical protein
MARKSRLEMLVWFPNMELLNWVEAQAARHERTLSQEIIYRLKLAYEMDLRRDAKGRLKKTEGE